MAFPDRPVAHLLGSNGPVHAVTYSSSPGTYILTGSADRSVRLYNPAASSSSSSSTSTSLTPSLALTAQASSITSRPPNPNGQPPTPQGKLIQTYAAHGYEVLSLSVSASNTHFASAGGDRAVFLWDVATAQTVRRFGGPHGHTARINSVAFAGHEDSLLVSGGFDTTVRIWDVKAGAMKPVQVLQEARDAVTCLVVRGPEIVVGSVDGRVRSYDVRMGRCVADAVGSSVTSLCLTRDGTAMLVGCLDSKLRLMDRDKGTCLKTFEDAEWGVGELRVQALLGGRERWVVAGDELTRGGGNEKSEGRVWVWDLLSGKVAKRIPVPWGPVGYEPRKKVVGRDGREKRQSNIVSCLAWREDGWGDQFCAGGTSGVVTVYGQR